MNRRLRRFFAGGSLVLAGAFVALSGYGWTAAAASPVVETSVQTELEDSPGWDCAQDGNTICGPTEAAHVTDAWASFDGEAIAEVVGLSKGFKATYYGTYSTEPTWPGYVAVPSVQYPNTFHAFRIDVGA